jgi:hypothetical protein
LSATHQFLPDGISTPRICGNGCRRLAPAVPIILCDALRHLSKKIQKLDLLSPAENGKGLVLNALYAIESNSRLLARFRGE